MVKLTPNRSHDCAVNPYIITQCVYTSIQRHQRTAKLNGTSLCCGGQGSGQVLGQQRQKQGEDSEAEREIERRSLDVNLDPLVDGVGAGEERESENCCSFCRLTC